MRTTYKKEDVIFLLQDLTGKMEPMGTEEREKAIQSGVHYSEMLPKEYVPTQEYMSIFEESLKDLSGEVAYTVRKLAECIKERKGNNVVLVSLARAGTPIGVLLKRYFMFKWGLDVPHYTVSIIRGKGIDIEALSFIASRHSAKDIQFIDGWVGKGAINTELSEACEIAKNKCEILKDLDGTLAVLTDPANVTDMYGTRSDFLIPSACLNATVTGLVSRTIYTENGLHGGVYFEDMEPYDKTYEFISEVEKHFKDNTEYFKDSKETTIKGIDEVKEIQEEFGIKDYHKVKPGIGETTRVLLRRVPDLIIIDKEKLDKKYYKHIEQLAKERNIKIVYRALKLYGVIGIIKELADV